MAWTRREHQRLNCAYYANSGFRNDFDNILSPFELKKGTGPIVTWLTSPEGEIEQRFPIRKNFLRAFTS